MRKGAGYLVILGRSTGKQDLSRVILKALTEEIRKQEMVVAAEARLRRDEEKRDRSWKQYREPWKSKRGKR